jgi:tryptophanyl-tRNA synthetase
LAFKEKLVLPSSTYHITIRNLKGEAKMSKRDPSTMLSLADAPKVAEKKLMSAFTGGRATAEEQKRLGGSIENDVLYELMRVHFCESDSLLSEMRADMETGRLLTGEYKKKYVPHILGWLKAHQEKKASLMHVAEEILKE